MAYLFTNESRHNAYRDLNQLANERGAQIMIANGDMYMGDMRFSQGWNFVDGKITEHNQTFIADAIYCIAPGAGAIKEAKPTDLIVNHPEMDAIGRDKLKQAEIFSEFLAKTLPINRENWQEVAAQIGTDKIVLKPSVGCEGNGVVIIDRDKLTATDIPDNEPYLAQEFVETSAGIPGIVEGRHDLRLILFNGEFKLSFLRSVKSGSYLANATQGATLREMQEADIPAEAFALAKQIDARFASFSPRLCAIDFMFGQDRIYLTEINTRPRFPNSELFTDAYRMKFYTSLLDIILNEVAQRRQAQ
jgi:glutathione synthase/RimK-type ligase-like ATP-grasp enzyme